MTFIRKFSMGHFVLLLVLLLWVTSTQALDMPLDPRQSVVKIYATTNPVDFYRPWQSQGNQAMTGSGTVLPGGRILTNAHVVADQTFIQVRKESDPAKYTARIEAIGYDCDLAILKVDDPQFFTDLTPLALGELPQLQDTVIVLGFPLGGDKLSITKGVVSRIEIINYTRSAKQLLSVQIDAAINPGNSGGPVVQGDKLIGLAMQVLSASQNIGYMIPSPIIQHFLTDLNDGRYDGFPTLGVEFHSTENPTLRQYYQLPQQAGGVVVSRVLPYSSASGHLQEDDVVMAIDDTPIAMDGTFNFRPGERLTLSYLINSKQIGATINITIIRDGKTKKIEVPLNTFISLIPHPNYQPKPSYYIYGGFVFTVLSMDLFNSWGKEWWEKSPIDFLSFLIGSRRLNTEKRKEIVVLLEVLPDNINVGYHGYRNEIINRVNGKSFLSFQEFLKLIHGNRENKIIFETLQEVKIILPTDNIDARTADILKRNNIPAQYSEDVGGWIK